MSFAKNEYNKQYYQRNRDEVRAGNLRRYHEKQHSARSYRCVTIISDPDEYGAFPPQVTLTTTDLECMLRDGVFTPDTILMLGKQMMRVVGCIDYPQRLVLIR